MQPSCDVAEARIVKWRNRTLQIQPMVEREVVNSVGERTDVQARTIELVIFRCHGGKLSMSGIRAGYSLQKPEIHFDIRVHRNGFAIFESRAKPPVAYSFNCLLIKS